MACWSSSGPAVPVNVVPSCFKVMTTGIVWASPSCFISRVPHHLPVKSAPLRVHAAISSRLKRILFMHAPFAHFCTGKFNACDGQKVATNLFANRHHRVHIQRAAGRQVACDQDDGDKQQRHRGKVAPSDSAETAVHCGETESGHVWMV